MPKLNLETKNKAQELVKAYLEENASEILAEKINNGVRIQKDGKTLISKKTLDGFMTYATDEAKKQAEKSARSACIEDAVVYGWAVHYFEEDSIEGTLYNEDGTEYKPQKPVAKPKSVVSSPAPAAPKPKPQMSLFDMLDAPSEAQKTPTVPAVSEPEEPDEQDIPDDEEPTEEEKQEVLAELVEEEREIEKKPIPKPAGSPLWQNYIAMQSKYPDHILAYRVGDFYEVFGDNAKLLAEPLNLTLTSRDCGLAERVLMVGFHYHAADNYFSKAVENGLKIAVAESFDEPVKLYERQTVSLPPAPADDGKHWVDEKTYIDEDGVVHNLDEETDDEPEFDMSAFDTEALAILDELLDNQIELR